MRIRLERLRIEGNDTPMNFDAFKKYFEWYCNNEGDLEPIVAEECGADSAGRLYIIRDGRHKFAGSLLAGRKDILAQYKEFGWIPQQHTGLTSTTSMTLQPTADSPSASETQSNTSFQRSR